MALIRGETGLVITASYSDGSTEDVTDSCTFSPAEGKTFDPETDTSVSISYAELGMASENIELSLTPVTLTGLSVSSNPARTAYIKGEHIDYAGLAVTASYSDSSTADVTVSCSISPRAGKTFDPDNDSSVNITYSEAGITETASIMLTEIYMTGLQVASYPRKTAYKYDERISYIGLVVSANYSDGSSVDVTGDCEITPKNNKKFDDETDTYVEITYSQGQDEASCTFSLTPITLTSLAVTANPDNTVYSSGEAISYSGIVVTASYSDSSEDDVTDKCVFSPSSGKAFSPETDTTVTITYTEGQNQQYCTLILTETAPMTLVVAAMPTKTSYNPGEALDFSGAVIKSQFQDGTTHTVTDFCDFSSETEGTQITVTAKCAHPAAPRAFDLNNGCVDGGTWRAESSSFSDVYKVTAGHKYMLILDENVGNRFKVMFTTSDVSKASADVAGTSITDASNPAIYASVVYTPPSNGYIVVTKDSGNKAGVKTYLYDADILVKNVTVQFMLSAVAITSLSITKPVKTRYRTGEKFDYTGAVVTATYSDGTVRNVTENASFSPVSGSTAVSDNPKAIVITQVIVSYGGLYVGFDVTMSGIAIMSLSVTPPDKTEYRTGENIDYTGCKVMAVYWDGSEKDVTSAAVFQPANGSPVSAYDIDETSNLPVSISYEETDAIAATLISEPEITNSEWLTTGINGTNILTYQATYFDEADMEEKTITFQLTKDYEAGCQCDEIQSEEDYQRILGEGFTFGHPDGTYETKPYTVYDAYIDELHEDGTHNGQLGYYRNYVHLLIAIWDDVTSSGEHLNFKQTDYRYFYRREFIPVLTLKYFAAASTTVNLAVSTLLPALSITPPEKTVYHYGEALEYSGYSAVATYSNGDTEDVTSLVTFYPRAGRVVTSSRSIKVSYSNAGGDYAGSTFEITVLRLSRIAVTSPEKTSYRQGEAINYTGATVTAVYSDGSMVDVTSSAVFSPTAGTVITEDTPVSITYTDQWTESASGSLSLTIITD